MSWERGDERRFGSGEEGAKGVVERGWELLEERNARSDCRGSQRGSEAMRRKRRTLDVSCFGDGAGEADFRRLRRKDVADEEEVKKVEENERSNRQRRRVPRDSESSARSPPRKAEGKKTHRSFIRSSSQRETAPSLKTSCAHSSSVRSLNSNSSASESSSESAAAGSNVA